MQIQQLAWENGQWAERSPQTPSDVHLALVFSGADRDSTAVAVKNLRARLPHAVVVGCSTAGEIMDTEVQDDSIGATLVAFERSRVEAARVVVADHDGGVALGKALAHQLPVESLQHVLVLSDGLAVNGSELARGMACVLPPEVSISGGLAGDGGRFANTFVVHDDAVTDGIVVAVGLYGDSLQVACGSMGGWDIFGPDRIVTRAEANVLYELDGQSALDLYKSYLGDYAAELPGSGLLFPLSLQIPGEEERVVRTILGVDEEQQSMTFAGDVPEGSRAQLMRANFDRLVDGAVGAARLCAGDGQSQPAWQLAVLISCVGRKMVLKQRIEEEVEGVREVIGAGAALAGFYSYGELSPGRRGSPCRLHNQTMTITSIAE